jgi:hypothetical protein
LVHFAVDEEETMKPTQMAIGWGGRATDVQRIRVNGINQMPRTGAHLIHYQCFNAKEAQEIHEQLTVMERYLVHFAWPGEPLPLFRCRCRGCVGGRTDVVAGLPVDIQPFKQAE